MQFDLGDDLDLGSAAAAVVPAPRAAAPATILVVGSPSAAGDGSYQALITELSSVGTVENEMVDRIVDAATALAPAHYTNIAVLLPPSLITSTLVALLYPALAPGATFQIRGPAADSEDVAGELRLVGLAGVKTSGGVLSSTMPKVASVPLSLKRPAAALDDTPSPTASPSALPLRTSRAAKASLWAFTTSAPASGATTPTIDESTLLTDADLERPTLVKREDCDVRRTRKACKNCSCGLREILLNEQEPDDLVAAGFAAPVVAATKTKKGVKKISAAVTSSCGNCYLGDAFRCGSCPYLGMPAFEPGQKVTISGMDDI